MIRKIISLERIVLLLFPLMVFATPAIARGMDGNLRVVASIAPLADFARQVGGGKVDVTLLLPAGASAHTYEPTPKTVQEVARARVFIKIGAGLEFWADRVVAAAARNLITVTCSQGVDLIKGRDDHGIVGTDPHIWLDPLIAINIVNRIGDAFSNADPANAAYFKRNAAAYIERLSALDREIAARVKSFRTKEYITFHSAWNYFARRYGLRVVGVIEEGPGKEPTAKHIDDILRLIRGMKTRVVFAEPQSSPRIAEAVAREAGGRVLILDDIGGQKGRETYIDLMHYDLSVMEEAMR